MEKNHKILILILLINLLIPMNFGQAKHAQFVQERQLTVVTEPKKNGTTLIIPFFGPFEMELQTRSRFPEKSAPVNRFGDNNNKDIKGTVLFVFRIWF